ncbi:hypothetical protein ACTXT7_002519 [Hymenolepis weldensis]
MGTLVLDLCMLVSALSSSVNFGHYPRALGEHFADHNILPWVQNRQKSGCEEVKHGKNVENLILVFHD